MDRLEVRVFKDDSARITLQKSYSIPTNGNLKITDLPDTLEPDSFHARLLSRTSDAVLSSHRYLPAESNRSAWNGRFKEHIGKDVKVYTRLEDSDINVFEGKLLSTTPAALVIETEEGVVYNISDVSRVALKNATVPQPKASYELIFRGIIDQPVNADLEIGYQVRDISWKFLYKIVLDKNGALVEAVVDVNLRNMSGASFEDALLRVVDGVPGLPKLQFDKEVKRYRRKNRAKRYLYQSFAGPSSPSYERSAESATKVPVAEIQHQTFEVHAFKQPVNIPESSVTTLKYRDIASTITVKKLFVYNASVAPFVIISLIVKNIDPEKKPLSKGTMILYEQNETRQPLGKAKLEKIPAGKRRESIIGTVTDIHVERKFIEGEWKEDLESSGKEKKVDKVRLKITNLRNREENIHILEKGPKGDWEVVTVTPSGIEWSERDPISEDKDFTVQTASIRVAAGDVKKIIYEIKRSRFKIQM